MSEDKSRALIQALQDNEAVFCVKGLTKVYDMGEVKVQGT